MIDALIAGDFEIWQIAPVAWALVEFVYTTYGLTLNVLTIAGDKEKYQEQGIVALEKMARENGAETIYSVGHLGWEPLMKKHGYFTERVLRMRKELT